MQNVTKLKTKDISRKKNEMIKPWEIIGIGGIEGWNLSDRRTWNLLLLNAWSEKLEDPTADFHINIRELRGLHDSNDRIRDCLEKLQKTLVSANMPDGTTRTVQMLGGTDIGDDDRVEGILKYDFHRKLVPLLRSSEIYARMEVKVLSALSSRYSLALYEVIASKIQLYKTSETIDIDTLRLWLGVEKGKLIRWPDFRVRAVLPAVKEVNKLTPFNVRIEPITRGRKVISVVVSWSKKEPFSPSEQTAMKEVNNTKVGRKSRLENSVDKILPELSNDDIEKGYIASANICRIDKYSAYRDWQALVASLPVKPTNLVGHFIDFCIKRAKAIQ